MTALQVALIGNPNTGKTSLFNLLTGSYAYVGNWSGVTVEKKVGTLRGGAGRLIDLPGVYSLNPLTRDESVVSQFMLTEPFSHILNIVDASQLQRNLHLTVQLLELERPVVVGLNMVDVAERRGIRIDAGRLSELLGIPIVPIVARSGKGCGDLTATLQGPADGKPVPFALDYGPLLEQAIAELAGALPDEVPQSKRWLAIQYLEGNDTVSAYMDGLFADGRAAAVRERLQAAAAAESGGKTPHRIIADVRQSFIQRLLEQAAAAAPSKRVTFTERVDRIVTNRFLGMPIFLAMMYVMFELTFDWAGVPLSDVLDGFISGPLSRWITMGLDAIGAAPFLHALIVQGIVAGVGGVLVFVPQIFILFLFISLLEDSGYMARVAMVMDRIMEGIGLNGKAFIPMIIGFGCNVPGVMASRTVEQPKERLLTILLTPLMSCSARLPVYALFVGAFFAKYQALVVLSLYVLGILVALLVAKVFSVTLLKSEQSFFFVELPPYRMPQPRTLWRGTWDKGKGFMRKAGTIIFGGSVAIWLLSFSGPSGLNVDIQDSFLARIGGLLAPLLHPLGFGTWQAGAALLTGFLAKEVVVSTMNIIYFTPDTDSLQSLMAHVYTPLSAYSLMAFVLLYVPCLATVASILKETGSRKWTFVSVGYSLAVAYAIALLIYQGGRLFGLI